MVIFLYGEDSFRSRQKSNEIKEKYIQSDKSGSGLSSFDAQSEKNIFEKLKNAISTANLLAPKRLVVVEDFITSAQEAEQKELAEYFKKNIKKIQEDEDIVVVFRENNLPKKTNTLFKILEKNAKSQNFEKYAGAKLNQWVIKRIHELDEKTDISRTALEKLIAYCGNETIVLEQEIQKLANHSSGDIISDNDVEDLVRASVDANIFRTVDALGANDKPEALRLLHNHLEKGDDPFYIFSMFIYQFRNLLKVADLRENKNVGEYEIARIAKMHPFVVKKSMAQIARFDFRRLKSIYKKLLDMDIKIKTGKIDIKLALDKFVAEL